MKILSRELEVAGKAAAAALQNTVYDLLSETFSNEYQFGFRYLRYGICTYAIHTTLSLLITDVVIHSVAH